MRSALLGLFAIPVIIGLIAFSNSSQACMEGGHSRFDESDYYLYRGDIAADAGNYTATVMVIEKYAYRVDADVSKGARVYILREEQMAQFTSGQEFSWVYNSAEGDHPVSMDEGKYWIVLDNRDGTNDATSSVSVMRPMPKAVETACITGPFYVPDVSSGFVAVAMVIATVIVAIVRRR